MVNSKLIGSILLIVGTSVGGGMLALPVATATVGFANSLVFLVVCWAIMTAGALLVLEVNLRLPKGSNMVSMARQTLGVPGQVLAWLVYLFLLYTLLAAYISGGSDVFNALIKNAHIHLSDDMSSILFTLIFGLIVYQGIRSVDYVNRSLMFIKLAVYALLVMIISPHIHPDFLKGGVPREITGSVLILMTSFGFASIVPSLRDYLDSNVAQLRAVIVFGSLVPLICYILWDGAIMGVISREGEHGLSALQHSNHATSGLVSALDMAIHSSFINTLFSVFTSVCMLTAFLGVSLGLFDFLADGLKLQKSGLQGKTTLLLTFIPPLMVVLFYPGIYLSALSYAGISCIVLLLLMPAVMAWRGRLANSQSIVLLPGGRLVLSALIIISIAILTIAT